MNNHCAVCSRRHDQLLMLVCTHDPCIQCAAKHYLQEMKIQADFQLAKNMKNMYPCEICFEITKLDPMTVAQIKLYADDHEIDRCENKSRKRKSKSNSHKIQIVKSRVGRDSPINLINYKRMSSPRESSTSSSLNLETMNFGKIQELKNSQLNRFLNSRTHDKKKLCQEKMNEKMNNVMLTSSSFQLCEKHRDEMKTYYCFKCEKSICAECAIHGEHVGHDVEAMKKAGEKLRNFYQQFLQKTQKYGTLVKSLNKQIQVMMEGVTQWSKRQKTILEERFRELHETLVKKEEKLLKQLNQQELNNLARLRVQQEELERLGANLKEKRKTLKQNVSRDVNNWKFNKLASQKQEIQKAAQKINEVSQRDQPKCQVVYLKCDLVEEAIDTIEDLVATFSLNIQDKELEGTATFRVI